MSITSSTFTRLRDFISTAMQMSHVYQPVMLRTLIDRGGKASVTEVAKALLAEDRAQLDYYREITKRMPGAVLRKRGVVDYYDGEYSIPGFEELTAAERHELIALCRAKVDQFLEKRADPWSHRRKSAGYVSGTLRYEVLKRAVFRCELCGASAEDRALEVDHIVPRNVGGSDDLSNLQALCFSCNAMKRDRDQTDFRRMAARYRVRLEGCIFCDVDPSRIVAENELMVAVKDAYPVTVGHCLLVPRRHVASPNDLYQPEINAMWALGNEMRTRLRAADPSISGFNFGCNDGTSAGQTVSHAHFHLIPRRIGDVEKPRGGVRGVIPSRQSY
jgi:diadenosine tetraphosphate (Ap4A) HIT family hydrolase/5-methylcytosine-specific restriction endonuclease McrA